MKAEEKREVMKKIVGTFAPIPLEYLATYDAVVVMQNADGSLELRLADPKMPGLSNVAIVLGLPGIRVEVQKGAPVKVGFSSGDPSKPFASLWNTNAAFVKIIVDGGSRPIARVNDETDSGTLVFRTVTQPGPLCTIEWKAPGSEVPIVFGVLGVMVTAPSVVEVPLSGIIKTGLEKVLG